MRRMAWKGATEPAAAALATPSLTQRQRGLNSTDADDESTQLLIRRGKLSPPAGDESGGSHSYAPPPPQPRATHAASVLNMVNCIMGVGVLGYPYCFKSSGTLLATLVMVVTALITRASYQLLLHAAHLSGRRTYQQVAEHATGRSGKILLEFCICASNLGCIVAYLNILADTLSSVAGTLIPPGAEPSRGTYMAGVTLFGALPVALVVRDHAVISAFSAASVAFVVIFAAVISGMAILGSPGAGVAAAAVQPMATWDPSGLLVALPVMAYSFTGHPYFLGIYEMLSSPSVRRMNTVTDQALSVTGAVYWIVGVCAYATFRDRTAGDVLRNFGGAGATGARGAYERAIKACFGLAVLGSIPLVIIPFYTIVQPLLQRRSPGRSALKSSPIRGGGGSFGKARQSGGGPGSNGVAASHHHHYQHTHDHSSGDGSSGRDPFEAPQLAAAVSATPVVGAVTAALSAPVAQQFMDPHLDPHLAPHDDETALSFPQHALLTFALLSAGMAFALFVPNLEFILGLTGATTSVVIAYIMPALCFLRLAGPDPEVAFSAFGGCAITGGATGKGGGACALGLPSAAAPPSAKPGLLAPPELRASWAWRRRMAKALLVFGVVAGVVCTHAILGSIQEEKAVVELAQELVAHEVVVAEAAHAQIKAKEAAAAISAVQDAAQELGSVRRTANQTLGALEAAAAALNAVANSSGSAEAHAAAAAAEPTIWGDIQDRLAQHKQKVVDDKALSSVEESLSSVEADMRSTIASVSAVVVKLDASIMAIKQEAARAVQDAADGKARPAAAAPAAAVPAAAAAEAAGAGAAAADSGGLIGSTNPPLPGSVAGATPAAAAAQPAAANATRPATGGGGGLRAGELARELGNALGVYGSLTSTSNATAGRSLEGVRDTAVVALGALNATLRVLEQVQRAVKVARGSHQRDAQVREAAVLAMRRALNATAVSALAMQITDQALRAAASSESSELLGALTRVAHDMEARGAGKGSSGKSGGKAGGGSSAAATAAAADAAGGAAAAGAAGATAAAGTGAAQPKPSSRPWRDPLIGGRGDAAASTAAQAASAAAAGTAGATPAAAATDSAAAAAAAAGAKGEGTAAVATHAAAPTPGGGTHEERVQRVKEVIAKLDQALAAHTETTAAAAAADAHATAAAATPAGAKAAPGAAAATPAAAGKAAPGGAATAPAAGATAAVPSPAPVPGEAPAPAAAANAAEAALRDAIQDAVEWTETSKTAAMSRIEEALDHAKAPRVAKRAADIVADIAKAPEAIAATAQQQGAAGATAAAGGAAAGGASSAAASAAAPAAGAAAAGAAGPVPAVAAAAAAAEEAAAAATAVVASATSPAAAAGPAAAAAGVAGPVVKVAAGGRLLQREEVLGPEVRVHTDGRLEQMEEGATEATPSVASAA